MSAKTSQKNGLWLAIALSIAVAVTALVLSLFLDAVWDVPLWTVACICLAVAGFGIGRMRELRRREIAAQRDQAAADAAAREDGSPQDDQGSRRLHISRLQ